MFTAFVAVTEKRYSVLLVSPVTTQLSAGAVAVQVNPPGEEVAVYEVIALWLSPGADHETVALSEPPTALWSSGRVRLCGRSRIGDAPLVVHSQHVARRQRSRGVVVAGSRIKVDSRLNRKLRPALEQRVVVIKLNPTERHQRTCWSYQQHC